MRRKLVMGVVGSISAVVAIHLGLAWALPRHPRCDGAWELGRELAFLVALPLAVLAAAIARTAARQSAGWARVVFYALIAAPLASTAVFMWAAISQNPVNCGGN